MLSKSHFVCWTVSQRVSERLLFLFCKDTEFVLQKNCHMNTFLGLQDQIQRLFVTSLVLDS